jgi:hypothetical protein
MERDSIAVGAAIAFRKDPAKHECRGNDPQHKDRYEHDREYRRV